MIEISNNGGERYPPWGTPVAGKGFNRKPFRRPIFTWWDLLVKYEENQDNKGFDIPYERSLSNRTEWLTESKALLKLV